MHADKKGLLKTAFIKELQSLVWQIFTSSDERMRLRGDSIASAKVCPRCKNCVDSLRHTECVILHAIVKLKHRDDERFPLHRDRFNLYNVVDYVVQPATAEQLQPPAYRRPSRRKWAWASWLGAVVGREVAPGEARR